MGTQGRPTRTRYFQQFAAALDDIESAGGLPSPQAAVEAWKDLWHREVHHSTAIEGNTLVLKEVTALLDTGRAVGARQHRDYLEVTGYAKAATWIYGNAATPDQARELVTVTEVKETHYRALHDVWSLYPHPDALPGEEPGNYRRHEIRPFHGGMTPPSHIQVGSDLDLWARDVRSFGKRVKDASLAPVEIPLELARIHRDFEAIHPFIDGNGRTGRLVLNLILVRLGWPPAIIYKSDRARYLDALDKADSLDLSPLAELLARSVVASTHHLLKATAPTSHTVPLAALASPEFSYAALKQAATRGRLEAHRGSDGVWRSSKSAVDQYRASRYERRK